MIWWQVEKTWSYDLACGKYLGIHGEKCFPWWHIMEKVMTVLSRLVGYFMVMCGDIMLIYVGYYVLTYGVYKL